MSVRAVVLLALLAVAVAVAAVDAQAAKPRWSAPQRVEAALEHRSVPLDHFAFAGNARGDRLLTWPDRNGMWFSISRRGGRFGKPRRIASPWTPLYIRAGLDAEGRAVILWSAFDEERQGTGGPDLGCCDRLLAAVVRPHRKPRARKLSEPDGDAGYPVFAVAPSGRFGVVWSRGDSLQARFGSTHRGFGRLEEVAEGIVPVGIVLGTGRPRVAVADGDTQLVEYSRRSAGDYTRDPPAAWDGYSSLFGSDSRGREVLARHEQHVDFTGFLELATRPPGGELTRQTVSEATGHWYLPALDVAPTGAAALAWTVEAKESDPERRRVRAVVRGPNGGFSSPRVVYTAPADLPEYAAYLLSDVAAAPRGGAAIAASSGAPSAHPHVVLVTRRGRVRVSHAVPSVGNVEQMAVLSDARGTAVAWATVDGIFASATR